MLRESLLALHECSGLFSIPVSLRSVLRHLPHVLKYVTLVLLLLNVRSFPLVWHLRIFRPVYVFQFQYYLLHLRTIFKSRSAKERALQTWFESLAPVGINPFEAVNTYKTWASIDDSDWNGHLSNSSYAKTNDAARFKLGIAYFPAFFHAGGWTPLGASYCQYLREIPMLHRYEVRQRIVGWENKWAFIVGRFVSHAKARIPRNEVSKEKDALETPGTLGNTTLRPGQTSSSDVGEAADAMRAIAAAQLSITKEADGATLHCVIISQLCFKLGRITVPPGLVLAISGFCAPPPPSPSGDSAQAYSRSNPPPHYTHVQSFFSSPTSRKNTYFLRGGWKDVPEAERWWVEALGGVVEEQRRANVEGLVGTVVEVNGPLGLLKKGMDAAKSV
ncbi:hypothetical protein PILCRDRAFT_815390 [Piloderma croceum F 1598]|uniref:Thioesterase domain-containing protein n=1 Tax=Piloderma croceum (strain F 1598) TaxID=765440 RepID=A0A0C3G532_PILCF|nr:hypothetical protein PILCRDRAFT_815390 [Piloderma croceum F 1598]